MNKRQIPICKFLVLAVFAALLVSLFLTSCGTPKRYDYDVTYEVSVNARRKTLTVRSSLTPDCVEAHKREKVYLFELTPSQSEDDLSSLTPLKEARISGRPTFTVKLNNYEITRLYSYFLLAVKDENGAYTAITSPSPVSDPEKLASVSERTSPDSIKGLSSNDVTDALLTSSSHSVIDVEIDKIILPITSEVGVRYTFGGREFGFDERAVAELDRKISVLNDSGVAVYLRILLGGAPVPSDDGKTAVLPSLTCPRELYIKRGEDDFKNGVRYYAPNMKDQTAVYYLEAFFDFISERYSGGNGAYGRADNLIIGSDVNDFKRNFSGFDSAEASFNAYQKLLRLADTAIRSRNKDARVYASMDKSWKTVKGGMTAKTMLYSLANASSDPYDFPWCIAMSFDPTVTDGYSINTDPSVTLSLTLENFSELTDLINTDKYLYLGKHKRSFIIDSLDFGTHKTPSDTDGEQKAASYLYTYLKLTEDGRCDAVIYSSVSELLSCEPLKEVYSTVDSSCKNSYDKYKSLLPSDAKSLYLSAGKRCEVLSSKISTLSEAQSRKGKKTALLDVSSGKTYPFSSNADKTEYREESGFDATVLNASFDKNSKSLILSHNSLDPSKFKKKNYLSLDLAIRKASAPKGSEDEACDRYKIIVLLEGLENGGISGICTAESFVTSGNVNYLELDISGFPASSMDSLTLTVIAVPENIEHYYGAELIIGDASLSR